MPVEYFQQSGLLSPDDIAWSMEDQLNIAAQVQLVITCNPDQTWDRLQIQEPCWQKMVVVYQSRAQEQVIHLAEAMQGMAWGCDVYNQQPAIFCDRERMRESEEHYLCLLIR